jgi:hypothetical protein
MVRILATSVLFLLSQEQRPLTFRRKKAPEGVLRLKGGIHFLESDHACVLSNIEPILDFCLKKINEYQVMKPVLYTGINDRCESAISAHFDNANRK